MVDCRVLLRNVAFIYERSYEAREEAHMRILAICVLFLTLIAGIAAAGKPQADKPITQELLDYDVNAVAYSI